MRWSTAYLSTRRSRLIPACTSAHWRTLFYLFFHRTTIREALILFIVKSLFFLKQYHKVPEKHLIATLLHNPACALNPVNNFKRPPIRNFKLQSVTQCSKRRPITAPYIIIKCDYCSAPSSSVLTIRVSIVIV